MSTLVESSFFLKFMFDECRTVMSVKRGCRVWRGGPTGPLNGIGEELDSLFNVLSSSEGDIKGKVFGDMKAKEIPVCASIAYRGGVSGGRACVVRSTLTGEWSDDRSRLDVAAAEIGGIPFVTQKSERSGSLFLLEGQ
jgi:hypothetical protein